MTSYTWDEAAAPSSVWKKLLNCNFNPFNTVPMAKIAVKTSIMRVVKFMSSPGNDFMS